MIMMIIIIIIIIIIGASNLELQFSVLLFSDFHFKALAFSVSNIHCSYKLPKEVMTRHRNFAGQSICLLVCLSIHLNNLSLDPSIHPSTYLSLHLPICLSNPSIHLSVYLSFKNKRGKSNLEVHLSVFLFSGFHFKNLSSSISNIHCSCKMPKGAMTR